MPPPRSVLEKNTLHVFQVMFGMVDKDELCIVIFFPEIVDVSLYSIKINFCYVYGSYNEEIFILLKKSG